MGLYTCTMYGGGGVSQGCRMHAGQDQVPLLPCQPLHLRLAISVFPPRAFLPASLLPKHQGSVYLPRLSQSVRVMLRFLAGQKYSLPRCTLIPGPVGSRGQITRWPISAQAYRVRGGPPLTILLHAAETGACVHGHGPEPKCPESHFRSAPHALDPIRPFTSHCTAPHRTARLTDCMLHLRTTISPPRLETPSPPCVPPARSSQQPRHGLRQLASVAFVITSRLLLTPKAQNCSGPTPIHLHKSASQPSRPASAAATARVHAP